MAELDKWQKRQAEEYAKENDVTFDAAVKVLFPPDPEVPAEEPAVEGAKDSTKAKVTK